ncbi:hypothetical protein [Anaeromicrobium sediminis]|uniref:Uncharacterized protein n=1 Tax=Anaeromicrobium sediminis TaxID=1478221 RepID=A0A267MHA8_9FIRM|nr:hypothetical protein [Anaeromicrobium sediminis]PAB58954.1 hypothetical protein CCE28_12275 [Anaeromicrobium sediminis]
MEISLSDLVDSCSDHIYLEMKSPNEEKSQNLKFLKELKALLIKYGKSTKEVDYIISELEGKATHENVISMFDIDEDKILEYIKKHPYFKNPCDYPIRLITIMKYLKKKGIPTNYRDMDLIVEKIILKMDGVQKVGDGMYLSNN